MALSTPILIGNESLAMPTVVTAAERLDPCPAANRPTLALLVLECPPAGCNFFQLAHTLREASGAWAALVAHRGELFGAIGPHEWFGCTTGNRVVGVRAWAAFYEVAEQTLRESGDLSAAVVDALAVTGG